MAFGYMPLPSGQILPGFRPGRSQPGPGTMDWAWGPGTTGVFGSGRPSRRPVPMPFNKWGEGANWADPASQQPRRPVPMASQSFESKGAGLGGYGEASGTRSGYASQNNRGLGEAITRGFMQERENDAWGRVQGMLDRGTRDYTSGSQRGMTWDADRGVWYKTPGEKVPYTPFDEWQASRGKSTGSVGGSLYNGKPQGRVTNTAPRSPGRSGEFYPPVSPEGVMRPEFYDEYPVDENMMPPGLAAGMPEPGEMTPDPTLPPLWEGNFDPFGGVTDTPYPGPSGGPPEPTLPPLWEGNFDPFGGVIRNDPQGGAPASDSSGGRSPLRPPAWDVPLWDDNPILGAPVPEDLSRTLYGIDDPPYYLARPGYKYAGDTPASSSSNRNPLRPPAWDVPLWDDNPILGAPVPQDLSRSLDELLDELSQTGGSTSWMR